MDVRTFESFSMKDAVKSVKQALGGDAVILSTREKPGPDGRGRVIEVTAAAASSRRTGAGGARAGDTRQGSQDATPDHSADPARMDLAPVAARITLMADEMATRQQVAAVEGGMRELKLLLIEALRAGDHSTLKDLPEPIIPVERQLRLMGVDEVSVTEVCQHLRALPAVPGQDIAEAAQYYRDQAVRWMMKRLRISPRLQHSDGSMSWQAIGGPTGVGKSTVVAKLAAHYRGREKARVGVISLDDRRLAAADQMRVFCRILDVPFATASEPGELAGIAERLGPLDLVLIDLPGISPKDTAGINGLARLTQVGLPIDLQLCLSVTEKETQMETAIRAYSPLGITGLIFTKLDESWSYGEIFNQSRRWQLPLAFFSTGQRIPEDIEKATRERVIERIFGL